MIRKDLKQGIFAKFLFHNNSFLVAHWSLRKSVYANSIKQYLKVYRNQSIYRLQNDKLKIKFDNLFKSRKVDEIVSKQPTYIIMDYFMAPEWLVPAAMAARLIQEKHGSTICGFDFRKPSLRAKYLYQSLGIPTHLTVKLSFSDQTKLRKLFTEIKHEVDTPGKLLEYQIDGINIGIDIYESILRDGFSSVNISSPTTDMKLYLGLLQYIFFKNLFEANKINSVIVSHDVYIGGGILSRMAYAHDVPVILIGVYQITISTHDFQVSERFRKYRKYYNSLDEESKIKGRQIAKKELSARLSGGVGNLMFYQEKSAFGTSSLEKQLSASDRIKVLIATHCFFDNPHAYSRMLFDDFWQWLQYLGEISLKTDYDWYVKIHRDFLPWEMEETKRFLSKYEHIRMVNPDTSFHQLADEGLDWVLTCYGSVGHELPLLGVNVLNSSYNPHIAYNFNYHAEGLTDYQNKLFGLEKLRTKKFDINEIYEFFYTHHHIVYRDNFLFPSYIEYRKYIENDVMSKEAFEYVIDNFNEISDRVISEVGDALQFNRIFSTDVILPNVEQLLVPKSKKYIQFFSRFDNQKE